MGKYLQHQEIDLEMIIKFQEYNIDNIPCKYLRVPVLKGAIHTNLWEKVISTCRLIFDAWKCRQLMLAGRTMVIKDILSMISIYMFSCPKLKKKVTSDLDIILKLFLWEGSNNKRRIPLISQDVLRKKKEASSNI